MTSAHIISSPLLCCDNTIAVRILLFISNFIWVQYLGVSYWIPSPSLPLFPGQVLTINALCYGPIQSCCMEVLYNYHPSTSHRTCIMCGDQSPERLKNSPLTLFYSILVLLLTAKLFMLRQVIWAYDMWHRSDMALLVC